MLYFTELKNFSTIKHLQNNFVYHVYPVKTHGDHMSAPIGLRGASAVTRRDLPSIERHSHIEL